MYAVPAESTAIPARSSSLVPMEIGLVAAPAMAGNATTAPNTNPTVSIRAQRLVILTPSSPGPGAAQCAVQERQSISPGGPVAERSRRPSVAASSVGDG